MALPGINAPGALQGMGGRASLPQIRASKALRQTRMSVSKPRQLAVLSVSSTPSSKATARFDAGPQPHRRSAQRAPAHTRSPRARPASASFAPRQPQPRDGALRTMASPAYTARATPRAKSAKSAMRTRPKSILKPQRDNLMSKSTPNLSKNGGPSRVRGTASEPHLTNGGSSPRVAFRSPRKQTVGTNAPQETQRTAPAFLTAFGNEEEALDAAQTAATQNPVASFLGGTSAGKLRWRKIVAKTNAVAKFSTGGRRNYKEWLRDKAKQDEEFFDKLWSQAEQEVQQEEDVARDSVNKFESAIEMKLSRKIAERVNLIDKLMRESSLAEFEPTRPGSANLPQHDPRHTIDTEEPIVPTLEEKWQLGLDVLRMQDRLDKIAPGNPNSPARVSSATSGSRVNNYPKALPPKPTRKVVCDNTQLSREAALLLIKQICGVKVVHWLKSKDGATTLKELAATYDDKDQDGNYTNRSTAAFETCAAKANVAFRRSSMLTTATLSG